MEVNFFNVSIQTVSLYISVSYSSDGNTGIVAGSILDVLNNLTQSSVEVEVNCCTQGVVSTPKICGNGVSCETICGEHNKGI